MKEDIAAFYWFDFKASHSEPPRFGSDDIKNAFGSKTAKYLGTGAYGETWLVQVDGTAIAAKIIHNDRYPLVRLGREVEGLKRVKSNHVVRILSARERLIAKRTHPVLEFEFVSGGDVMSTVRTGSWPTSTEVVPFARGLFEGIEALHGAETVHRDIKLENIALREGSWSFPVVLDLGLARLLDKPSLTSYPGLIGTLPYMSPEQMRGERANKGSDLWSAGVVLHLLVAHEHPFFDGYEDRLDQDAALDRVMSGPRPLPQDIDAPLRSICSRLLSSDPYLRGSARRARAELEELAK